MANTPTARTPARRWPGQSRLAAVEQLRNSAAALASFVQIRPAAMPARCCNDRCRPAGALRPMPILAQQQRVGYASTSLRLNRMSFQPDDGARPTHSAGVVCRRCEQARRNAADATGASASKAPGASAWIGGRSLLTYSCRAGLINSLKWNLRSEERLGRSPAHTTSFQSQPVSVGFVVSGLPPAPRWGSGRFCVCRRGTRQMRNAASSPSFRFCAALCSQKTVENRVELGERPAVPS